MWKYTQEAVLKSVTGDQTQIDLFMACNIWHHKTNSLADGHFGKTRVDHLVMVVICKCHIFAALSIVFFPHFKRLIVVTCSSLHGWFSPSARAVGPKSNLVSYRVLG